MSKKLIYSKLSPPKNWFRGIIPNEPYIPYNILIFTRTGTDLSTSHVDFHHRFVLITSLHGNGLISIDQKRIKIREGASLLVFPFQYHRYLRWDRNILWLYITFDIKDPGRYESLRFITLHIYQQSFALLDEITKTYISSLADENKPACSFLLGAYLEKMLEQIPKTTKKRLKYTLPASQEIIQKICRYIYENMDKHITIKHLAKFVNISPSTLRLIFKKNCGISVGSYLSRAKLCHASVLLHNTNLPIKRIAAECGYLSVSSFIRSFKETAQVTPAKYRKKKYLFSNNLQPEIRYTGNKYK